MADDKPIIVIKKKGGHGGHHGGAWKVAYADFVTAMMCFFMVMWLINSSDQSTRQNIATYFKRPGLFTEGSGTPLMIGEAGIVPEGRMAPKYKEQKAEDTTESYDKGHEGSSVKVEMDKPAPEGKILEHLFAEPTPPPEMKGTPKPGATPAEAPPGMKAPNSPEKSEEALLEQIAQQVRDIFRSSPEMQQLLGMVDVSVDSRGLNIEILDTDRTSMFRSGSAEILPEARAAFTKLGGIINTVPHTVDLVGHTDANPLNARGGTYTNWELSADRANAARRLLEESGTPPGRIGSVVGKADTELKDPQNPKASGNRRITLRVRFSTERTVDLDKDPNALDILQNPPTVADQSPSSPASTSSTGRAGRQISLRAKQDKPVEKSLTLTPKEILANEKRKGPIKLPPEQAGNGDDPKARKPRVLTNSPVIKPFDIMED